MDTFNTGQEITRITHFLKSVFSKTGKKNGVIAWSGGIDSTVCLYLLARSVSVKNISILHLPFEASHAGDFKQMADKLEVPTAQFHTISIQSIVNGINNNLQINDPVRLGNVMARVRMVIVYDYAKKCDALVCGTENRTEDLLGYFTRFGDEASDIEPIRHLFKTQVYALARELVIPETIIKKSPSAELWKGQTDEGDFGFAYAEADEVLHRYYDKKMSVSEIERKGFVNAKQIISRTKSNAFKHKVPYSL